jgi:hypothetical protein
LSTLESYNRERAIEHGFMEKCKGKGRGSNNYVYKVVSGVSWCISCDKPHPVSAFFKDKYSRSGLMSRCRDSVIDRERKGRGLSTARPFPPSIVKGVSAGYILSLRKKYIIRDGKKWCFACAKPHPTEAFGKNGNLDTGLAKSCKMQTNKEAKERADRKRGGPPKYVRYIHSYGIVDGKSWCKDCEEWIPTSEVHAAKSSKTGYLSRCKICYAKYQKNLYRENPVYKLNHNKWRDKNKDKINAYVRDFRKKRKALQPKNTYIEDKIKTALSREVKTCTRCDKEKLIKEFNLRPGAEGRYYPEPRCRQCRKEVRDLETKTFADSYVIARGRAAGIPTSYFRKNPEQLKLYRKTLILERAAT